MRTLLIANARAHAVTPGRIRFIRRALATRTEVDLVRTGRRGHAAELARGAVASGYDVVAALGGDGTVNEVANGLAGTHVPLGIIPGGGADVLARSLGIPREPVRAAGHLLARLGGPARRIGLGRAGDRYFTFACGIGLDGAIVRHVEGHPRLKRLGGYAYYLWSGLRLAMLGYDLRSPRVRMRWGPALEREREGLTFLISQNGRPFTFLFGRPMNVCPRASVDLGLDCLGVGAVGRLGLLRMILQTFGSAGHVRRRDVAYVHDATRIEVECARPLPVQADGEDLGDHDRLVLESAPGALSVLV